MIRQARHLGSVPPDVHRTIRRAIKKERVYWHQDTIEELSENDAFVGLRLASGDTLCVDRVLLATGFESRRPGGALVDKLVESAGLPCAECGYPIVDPFLRWHPRVFVSGPLAELELGPTAKNSAGARSAGHRIVRAVHASQVPDTHCAAIKRAS